MSKYKASVEITIQIGMDVEFEDDGVLELNQQAQDVALEESDIPIGLQQEAEAKVISCEEVK